MAQAMLVTVCEDLVVYTVSFYGYSRFDADFLDVFDVSVAYDRFELYQDERNITDIVLEDIFAKFSKRLYQDFNINFDRVLMSSENKVTDITLKANEKQKDAFYFHCYNK